MNTDTLLSTLLTIFAACYLLLGARLIGSRREIGSVPIGVLFIVVSFWVMGGAVELASTTFTAFSVGRTGHFIAQPWSPSLRSSVFGNTRAPKRRRA